MPVAPRMGWLVVAGVALLPWMTWVGILDKSSLASVVETPFWMFVVGGLGLVAMGLWETDRWLSVLVGYVAIWEIPAMHPTGFEVGYGVSMGALALIAARKLPISLHGRVVQILCVTGALQVAYVVVQWTGRDPLWWGWDYKDFVLTKGTLGNQTFVGAFLAVLTPLAPYWLMPWFLGGIALTKCAMGLIAALVGIGIRCRMNRWGWIGLAGLAALALWCYPHVWESLRVRLVIWERALLYTHWAPALLGYGPGAWLMHPRVFEGELFLQAHNEYLQVLFEFGLVGVAMVAGWCWYHQAALRRSFFAGSVVSLALMCLTMFPFHLAITGLQAALILGLATTEGVADEMA